MQKRFENIDLLRGFSIIVMILTHTNAYFMHHKTAFDVWNFLHFSVPTFVFCSGFVLANRYKIELLNFSTYMSFVGKRLLRLLKPYYIFLIFFYIMLFFSQKRIDPRDIISALLIVREPDISWLVNLFVQFTLLFPIFSYLFNKQRKLFDGLFGIVLIYAFWKIFNRLNLDYKVYMVWSWSLPFMFAFYFAKYYQNIKFKLGAMIIFLVLHLSLRYYLSSYGANTILQDNKYPPNLYYLSYGIFWFIMLDFIFNLSIFKNKIIFGLINFFSKNSFSLFFIHYLVIQVTFRFFIRNLQFNEWTLFFYVIIISSIVQLSLIKLLTYARR